MVIRILMIQCSLVALWVGAMAPHAMAGKDDNKPQGLPAKPKAPAPKVSPEEANAQRLSQGVRKLGLKADTAMKDAGPKLRGWLQKENYSPAAVKAAMDGFLAASNLNSLKINVLDLARNTGRVLTPDEAQMGLNASRRLLDVAKAQKNPAAIQAAQDHFDQFWVALGGISQQQMAESRQDEYTHFPMSKGPPPPPKKDLLDPDKYPLNEEGFYTKILPSIYRNTNTESLSTRIESLSTRDLGLDLEILSQWLPIYTKKNLGEDTDQLTLESHNFTFDLQKYLREDTDQLTFNIDEYLILIPAPNAAPDPDEE